MIAQDYKEGTAQLNRGQSQHAKLAARQKWEMPAAIGVQCISVDFKVKFIGICFNNLVENVDYENMTYF